MRAALALSLIAGYMAVAMPADAADPFPKLVTVTVSSDAGNGYDVYARAVTRHWAKHMPGNPEIVVKNQPGAGGLKLANWMYNQAAKDGSEVAAFQNGTVLEKAFHTVSEGGKNAMFDATKFGWIGTPNQTVFLLVSWHTAPVKVFDDLYKHELIVGASSANSDNGINAILLNKMFGAKLKVIYGYSGPALDLAIERGELQGAAGKDYSSITSVRPAWISEKQVNLLVQLGMKSHPDLKDVPLALDLAKTDEQRKILELIFAKYAMARPLTTTPGVPADRLAALRASFDATMKDKGYIADAEKQRMELDPLSGAEVQKIVEDIYSTPEPLLAKAREMIQPK